MANNLGIPEVSLTEIIAPATVENTIAALGRISALDPLVVRVLGHDDDVALEEDDPDKMALFTSKAQGHPWIKESNTEKKIIFEAADGTTPATSDATYIVPFFDYTDYE